MGRESDWDGMKIDLKKQKLIPLPCPFCGKNPKVSLRKTEECMGGYAAEVFCANMRCFVFVGVEDGVLTAKLATPSDYINRAIKRWNRRK